MVFDGFFKIKKNTGLVCGCGLVVVDLVVWFAAVQIFVGACMLDDYHCHRVYAETQQDIYDFGTYGFGS